MKSSLENCENQKKSIGVIDLFCGIGGLTYGLKQAGLNVIAGIDLDSSCKYAYETNNEGASFISDDIETTEVKSIVEKFKNYNVKILVGCAPCQPFSTHSNKIKDREKSDKWNLLNHFLRLIKESKPDIVSMENVPNLANKEIFESFVNELIALGYYVSYQNIFCPDYGIPQKRRRLVLLASLYGKISIIEKTHTKDEYISVRAVIGELEHLRNGQKSKTDKLHFTTRLSKKNLERIKASKQNGTWDDWKESLKLDCHKEETGSTYKSVYGRMSWDEPSPTITTQFFNYGTGRFGHPEQNRALTIREAAILQTFPNDYIFVGDDEKISMNNLGMHIGNAVPPRLGEIIGESIITHIEQSILGDGEELWRMTI